ncbi:MAG: DUF2088 domain-containing protein [Planctomycetales bacterium]|nr:DUF2088 domain-containing protein [Planctomycetales bacterium]
MTVLHFGANAEIAIPDETLIAGCGDVVDEPIDDIPNAIRDALQSPDGYPDLRSMTIPEDKVAIALEDGLVHSAEAVAGIVSELLSANVQPERIVILRSKLDAQHSQASPTRLLPESVRSVIECVVHDPTDREMVSYLGVSADDSPIYVNRQLADADVVIPVGMMKHNESLGDVGVHGIVVPHFCDEETIARFLQPKSAKSKRERLKRRDEAREIAWMLGTRLTVQFVLGNGEAIQHVLAGDAELIENRGQGLCEKLWRVSVPQRANLVVASITGGKQQQSWANFARTLRNAMQVVEPDGTIALCTELNVRPGAALRKVVGATSLDLAERSVKKDRSIDALAALELIASLQNNKVYLLSKMDEEFVEELGLGFIAHPDEVTRLANRHESCILIENAQRVVASVSNESPAKSYD